MNYMELIQRANAAADHADALGFLNTAAAMRDVIKEMRALVVDHPPETAKIDPLAQLTVNTT